MKLISMTDFVIENENMIKQTESEMSKDLFKLAQYAHFLKQPLELWMFVPCDEDGNILQEPKWENEENDYEIQILVQDYEQAKERCLFDEVEVEKIRNYYVARMCGENVWFSCDNDAIEDLVKYNPQLTQTAIKQLGL